jgi:hypothetical protein
MNNPAHTWIKKSVNTDNPISKEKSDKIRKCRCLIFFPLDAENCFFGTPALVCRRWTPLAVGSRVCLVLPHMMPAKIARWPKRGGLY